MPIYFPYSPQDIPIIIECIGHDWMQEPISRPNGHPLYHWLQTEEGEGQIEINEQTIYLPKGAGIFISPYTPISYKCKEDYWKTAFVTFWGHSATDLGDSLGNGRYLLFEQEVDPFFLDWIHQMVDNINTLELNFQTKLVQSVECYRFLMHLKSCSLYQSDPNAELYNKYLLPVIKKIKLNYMEQLSTEELAKLVYITPQYLSRLFKRYCGVSTYEFLMNYRIDKAKELLKKENAPNIQEIGFQVGFSDSSHFISVFKKTTGHTPTEFKKLSYNVGNYQSLDNYHFCL